MKVYAKCKCRNCCEIFLHEPDETDLTREEFLSKFDRVLITDQCVVKHVCYNGEIGIADGIALVLKE